MENKPSKELSWIQDKEDLERALLGNKQAVQSIVSALSKSAFYLAYKTVLDVNDAEDCVQEAFFQLWNSKNQFQGKSSLKTYFFRFVLNACFASLKKRKDTLSLDEEMSSETAEIPSVQPPHAILDRIDLHKALSLLAPRQRTAIVLWAYFDYSSHEIGDLMELNKNAVDQLLHRAKQQLRKFLIEEA
jgi:RNA polymerase sigma-70 factor, ECF subfamily